MVAIFTVLLLPLAFFSQAEGNELARALSVGVPVPEFADNLVVVFNPSFVTAGLCFIINEFWILCHENIVSDVTFDNTYFVEPTPTGIVIDPLPTAIGPNKIRLLVSLDCASQFKLLKTGLPSPRGTSVLPTLPATHGDWWSTSGKLFAVGLEGINLSYGPALGWIPVSSATATSVSICSGGPTTTYEICAKLTTATDTDYIQTAGYPVFYKESSTSPLTIAGFSTGDSGNSTAGERFLHVGKCVDEIISKSPRY